MSNLSVTYNGAEQVTRFPVEGGKGCEVEMVHSLAGESLEVNSAIIQIIGREVKDAGLALADKNDYNLLDADELQLAESGAPYYNHYISFSQQKPVEVKWNGRSFGKYYSKEMKLTNKRDIQLVAYSAIWLLKLKTCPARFCTGTETVADIIAEIMGGIEYALDDDLGSRAVRGWLPAGTAYEQLFHLLLVKGGGCFTEPSGRLRFRMPSAVVSSRIKEDRVFECTVEEGADITYLELTYYDYIQDGTEAVLFSGTVLGERTILFSEPHYSLRCEGGTITAQSAGYATITANGSVTLYGKGYVEVSGKLTKGNPPTGVETDNTKSISGYTLTSFVDASAMLDRLWHLYTHSKVWKGTIVVDSEVPGNYVQIIRPDDNRSNHYATINRMRYQFGAKECRAQIEARLDYMPYGGEDIAFTHYRLLTLADGETGQLYMSDLGNPEAIYVIVVGGGSGGHGGDSGTAGGSIDKREEWSKSAGTSGSYPASWNTPMAGGKGGKGGARGQSGLINTILIKEPRGFYSFSIGRGGAGGSGQTASRPADYTPPGVGTPSAFIGAGGECISDDGMAYPSGYYDSLSTLTFGRQPVDGIEGGYGGNGATYPADGTPGGDAGIFHGSAGGEGHQDSEYISVPGGGFSTTSDYGGGGGGGASGLSNGKGTSQGSSAGYSGGRDGADGGSHPAPSYGDGGNGGHGGGGGGGAGTHIGLIFDGRTFDYTKYTVTGGKAGLGGNGQPGGDGCILILY